MKKYAASASTVLVPEPAPRFGLAAQAKKAARAQRQIRWLVPKIQGVIVPDKFNSKLINPLPKGWPLL